MICCSLGDLESIAVSLVHDDEVYVALVCGEAFMAAASPKIPTGTSAPLPSARTARDPTHVRISIHEQQPMSPCAGERRQRTLKPQLSMRACCAMDDVMSRTCSRAGQSPQAPGEPGASSAQGSRRPC